MIQGIDQITYSTDGTPDNWANSRQFFIDWGLTLLTDTPNELLFETANGAQVRVLPPDHAALNDCPAMEAGATLREVVWGVAAGSTIPAPCLDPHGLRQRFQHTIKRNITLEGSPSNVWGDTRRVNAPSPIYEHATPIEVCTWCCFLIAWMQPKRFTKAWALPRATAIRGAGCLCAARPRRGTTMCFCCNCPINPRA